MFFRMLYCDQVMGKVQLDCHSSSGGWVWQQHWLLWSLNFKMFLCAEHIFPFVYSLLCTIVVAKSSDANLKTV